MGEKEVVKAGLFPKYSEFYISLQGYLENTCLAKFNSGIFRLNLLASL